MDDAHRSSARDSFSQTLPKRERFFFFEIAKTAGPRGLAAAVETKNSPPDCFLNVSTVLKEIVLQITTSLQKAGTFYFCAAEKFLQKNASLV
ncbi:MAG: hypothetical protein IJR60_03270 [Eubacterium sp.]|nr:hypothetical protein [Eubacterium sp.]